MSKTIAILGKAGVGKTFFSAHLAMAFGYLGDRTLVVGCDQKRDVSRALSGNSRPSLMEALEKADYNFDRVNLENVICSVSSMVDVIELGPSQLLVGHYAGVLEDAFGLFEENDLLSRYSHVIFDVTDERFDAVFSPIFRQVNSAVALTDDSPESLFVVNRLIRAALIGSYEFNTPLRIVGMVNNRSRDQKVFEKYVERTRCYPLLTIGEHEELARLRRSRHTLFSMENLSPAMEEIVDHLLKIAELLRGEPFNLMPVSPMDDEDVWELVPPVHLPN